MEKAICRGVADAWGGTTILKGLNAEGSGAAMKQMWDEFDDPIAVSTDATRFDQHVSVDALKWEHSVYALLTSKNARAKLEWLLEMQLKNRGFARTPEGTVKYEVAGRRMSGDMNTGMGNCLLMSAMFYAYRQHCRVHFRLANNGDDCVAIMERRDFVRFSRGLTQYFRDFGFVLEVEEKVDVFEAISFCQTNPVWDGSKYVMVRDPRVCMAKDAFSTLGLDSPKSFKKWMHAIGTCGISLSGGMPILQEYYQLYLRHGMVGKVDQHPVMDTGFARLARGMDRKYVPVSDEARVSFWRAFGILPDAQTAVEGKLAKHKLVLSARELIADPVYPFGNL